MFQGRIQGGVYPNPPKIGENMIFWRKIVIFHTKYPNFHASLCSVQFLSAPPTWNPGSAPALVNDKIRWCILKGYCPQALEFRTPFFLIWSLLRLWYGPWIFVWKYIFEPFIHIFQHFVLQLSRSTNFCF
jgi:hypothetical protein